MARVLIVDDDPQIRELLRTALELEGYEVVSAEDGRIGLRCFSERRPDLVITDMILPEQEGIETIRKLRELDALVPILAISGSVTLRAGRSHLAAARRSGANRSLAKPFGIDELKRAVSSLLGELDA